MTEGIHQKRTVRFAYSGATTNTEWIAAPGAGKRLIITRLITSWPEGVTALVMSFTYGSSHTAFGPVIKAKGPDVYDTKHGNFLELPINQNFEGTIAHTGTGTVDVYIEYEIRG